MHATRIDMDKVLEVRNISKTYGTGDVAVKALKETNLSFHRGEFTAIIGKSGSGKTTLLRILGTLDKPNTGEVVLEGSNVLDLKDKELSRLRRRKIGFVYQDYNLFPEFTAYENIIMPIHLDEREADKKEVEELMDQLGILHCKDKFPAEMSGGEQQRVSIARALVTKPVVVLADEPSGNLDVGNSNSVAMLLGKASKVYNQTIVMVTHDNSMASYADRIISIVDGIIQENEEI